MHFRNFQTQTFLSVNVNFGGEIDVWVVINPHTWNNRFMGLGIRNRIRIVESVCMGININKELLTMCSGPL